MLRSMYSGISGMKNFQTKLDVIGNNIANVNTYGYKKGRVVFKDMINQNISGASAAGDTRGGVNPRQVGLGSQLSTIDTIHTTGSLQSTGRVLDLAVSGSGFFQATDKAGTETFYTRAGNFYMDNNGDLVTGDGLYLEPKINIPTDAKSMSIGQDGTVNYIDKDGELKEAGQLTLAKFPNDGGLEKVGGNYFRETTNSGTPTIDDPGSTGIGTIESGFLEMSNVDLSEEFTEMIVAQRGFQANTRIITTSDEILQELVNLKR
ncbi:flagellar basal body rod protein FlgG [Rossellomorea vietnamensis]|uniref:Flagellar hook protein FlgE n=1 Tax=Rossellomorea vietnamensis TaxID=218284 RepID=A0A0P6W7Z7_9BACI|nr:flagellar basal body rod protein FlgG [Rossellomorea vietnamensis]KPL61127.1 flagellar biosynthesis protein FlgG [Rossellomorea vietnamensis]